jgi:hypothetical protein
VQKLLGEAFSLEEEAEDSSDVAQRGPSWAMPAHGWLPPHLARQLYGLQLGLQLLYMHAVWWDSTVSILCTAQPQDGTSQVGQNRCWHSQSL